MSVCAAARACACVCLCSAPLLFAFLLLGLLPHMITLWRCFLFHAGAGLSSHARLISSEDQSGPLCSDSPVDPGFTGMEDSTKSAVEKGVCAQQDWNTTLHPSFCLYRVFVCLSVFPYWGTFFFSRRPPCHLAVSRLCSSSLAPLIRLDCGPSRHGTCPRQHSLKATPPRMSR